MSKNVVIVSSSLRQKSNSETLCDEFARGARESGHSVTQISLRDFDLKYCIGCLKCLNLGKCVLNDSVNQFLPIVQNADVLVFATPIYYYSMAGQLKTFLDRMNPLYPKTNKFKEVYLLTAAAENSETVADGAITEIQGWIDCFEGVSLKGVINALSVNDVGEAVGTEAAQQAYITGKSI